MVRSYLSAACKRGLNPTAVLRDLSAEIPGSSQLTRNQRLDQSRPQQLVEFNFDKLVNNC